MCSSHKLIKGVIKGTNENYDRYHYNSTRVLSSFSSVSQGIKAAKLMSAPMMLYNRCCPLSHNCSPSCVMPTKLNFRPILLCDHLRCVFVPLCVFLLSGRPLHVLSIWPLHRAAGFCHPEHYGGVWLVHLLHRHHVLPGLPGLRHKGNVMNPI